MASQTEICNMALGHLGAKGNISNISESTTEAIACSTYYEASLKFALESFPWHFAQYSGYPALLASETDSQFAYVYTKPSDCIRVIKILGGLPDDPIPFEERAGMIYTDQEEAEIQYTKYISDPNEFSPSFLFCFSMKLATDMCMKLTRNTKLQDRLANVFDRLLAQTETLSSAINTTAVKRSTRSSRL